MKQTRRRTLNREVQQIAIRRLTAYHPRPGSLNLMWLISQPDKVTDQQLDASDHVFVASPNYARWLRHRLRTPVSTLLQCTDSARFRYRKGRAKNDRVVFIGNAKGIYRDIVRNAVESGVDLAVYGRQWAEWIDPSFIEAEHVDNRRLSQLYAENGVVLNDHWDSMREHGFVSNRLFDAAACGATVISDEIPGLDELFDGEVRVYRPGETDLGPLNSGALEENRTGTAESRRARLAETVALEHSFDARARTIHAVIEAALDEHEPATALQ